MSDIKLATFPNDKYSALTMLYLEQSGIGDLSPEELLDKYYEVYEKIKAHNVNHTSVRVTRV